MHDLVNLLVTETEINFVWSPTQSHYQAPTQLSVIWRTTADKTVSKSLATPIHVYWQLYCTGIACI